MEGERERGEKEKKKKARKGKRLRVWRGVRVGVDGRGKGGESKEEIKALLLSKGKGEKRG